MKPFDVTALWPASSQRDSGFFGRAIFGLMKIAQGRIVRGAVVTRSRFPDGTRITLVEHDERVPLALDPDEEAAILKGIAELEAGRGVSAARLRAKLRRR